MPGELLIPRFPGLRLDADPQDMGLEGAQLAEELWYSEAGGIGARPAEVFGTSAYASGGTAPRITGGMIFRHERLPPYMAALSRYLLCLERGTASTLLLSTGSATDDWRAFTEGGAQASVARAANSKEPVVCVHASPALTRFVCTARGDSNVRQVAVGGLSFSTLAPPGNSYGVCATWPVGNRLVVAACSAGSSAGQNLQTVRFSNPGDPTTWATNSYVDLGPGDGDGIMAMACMGEVLFVFKERSAFVFYGVGTLGDGSPEFQWRQIPLPSPLAGPNAWCVTPFGLLLSCLDGLYVTTGGAPQRWEPGDAVRPLLWRGRDDPGYGSPAQSAVGSAPQTGRPLAYRLAWVDGRLFLDTTLVWFSQAQAWSRWSGGPSDSSKYGVVLGEDGYGNVLGCWADSGTLEAKLLRVWLPGLREASTGSATALLVTGFSDLGTDESKRIVRTGLDARASYGAVDPRVSAAWFEPRHTIPNAASQIAAYGQLLTLTAPNERLWARRAWAGRRLALSVALQQAAVDRVAAVRW